MNKQLGINKLKIIPLITLLLIAVLFRLYWDYKCMGGGCSYILMDTVLDPIYYASISLSIFFTVFLLLPTRYLVSWLKYCFSWLFPIGALIVASNISTGGGVFPIFARETIIMYSIFAGIVTLLFIAYKFYSERKS